ncbi:hypothetical protein DFH28DRAFT_1141021 [Melampsora americana]|nr:hypothetical protein DFH28DRAFT_1141021 [Melampsora americana]
MSSPSDSEPENITLEPGTVVDIKPKTPKSVRCVTVLNEALIGKDDYTKVHLYATPCSRCAKTSRVCVTVPGKSIKCRDCKTSKVCCDVNGMESIEFRWLSNRSGKLYRDSKFDKDRKTVASSTCAPEELSLLAPEDEARVDDWTIMTQDVESLASTQPPKFDVEIPLSRSAGARIIQDDIRADAYLRDVMGWRRSREAPPSELDANPNSSRKRPIEVDPSSEEDDHQPSRRIKITLRKPLVVEDDKPLPPGTPPISHTSHRQAPQPSSSDLPPSLSLASAPSNLATARRASAAPNPSLSNLGTARRASAAPNPSLSNPRASRRASAAPVPSLSNPGASRRASAAPVPSLSNPRTARPASAAPAPLLSNLGTARQASAALEPSNSGSIEWRSPQIMRTRPQKTPSPSPSPTPSRAAPPSVLGRTSQTPLFRHSSPIEEARPTEEQVHSPQNVESPTEEHEKGGNDEMRLNESEVVSTNKPEHELSVDPDFLQAEPRGFEEPRSNQGHDHDSDDSSVDWGEVKPNQFDSEMVAQDMKRNVKDMTRFMAGKMMDIAALIPAGKRFDTFISIRTEIQDMLKVYKEGVKESLKPLENL